MQIFLFLVCLLMINPLVEGQEYGDPEQFPYDEDNQLKIYCVRPLDYDPSKQYPAIVIFHGGGWSIGEASWGFGSAEHFASKGMVAFSAQYRLQTDETDFTPYESVLDAQSAIRWVRKNASKFSIDDSRIAAYGWSAGAHLAACAAVFDNLDAPDEDVSSAPNLLALKSPAVSLMIYEHFQSRLGDKIDVADLSPAEHVSESTPASIIVIGKSDTVTPLEGAKLYHRNMLTYDNDSELHVYPDVGHLFTPSSEPDDGWPNPDKDVSESAQRAIDYFLERHGYINH